MMNNFPRDWRIHGVFPQTPLLAGVLPCGELHYLAGKAVNDRDAVVADLATAVASDTVTCGLSAADKAGARASRAGFFGQPAGAATGVAIITSAARAEALDRAIQANALARHISQEIPVAVLGLIGTGTEHLTGAHARISELSGWMRAVHDVDLGLIVLDGLALPQSEVSAFQRHDRAALCVCESAPAAPDGAVVEISDGRLTLAKPAEGAPWAKEFALEVVSVAGAETLVVRPGKAVTPAPIWKDAAPVARKVVVAPPEVPITSRVALVIHRGELSPDARLRLATQGFDEIVESQDTALPKPGQMVGGKREIVISGEDQLPSELKARATRLREEAVRRGVADDIVINVAA